MRDPARIQELFNLLNQLWLVDPDLRFNQLIYILQSEFSQKNNGDGEIKEIAKDGYEKIGYDLFHLEDDKFIDYLKTKIPNEKGI